MSVEFPYTRINPKVKNPAGLVQQNLEYFSTKAAQDIDTVNGEINTVQTDLDAAEANITTIQGQITTIQGQITALQAFDAKIKSGQATIASGFSSVTVTHNFGSTSYDFVCTPRGPVGFDGMLEKIDWYATTKQANSIVIALTGTPDPNVAITFDWILRGT